MAPNLGVGGVGLGKDEVSRINGKTSTAPKRSLTKTTCYIPHKEAPGYVIYLWVKQGDRVRTVITNQQNQTNPTEPCFDVRRERDITRLLSINQMMRYDRMDRELPFILAVNFPQFFLGSCAWI